MSADLRLSNLMKPQFQEPAEAAPNSTASGISGRLKMILIVIVASGAIGGSIIAYLILTAPGRPEVDTSGKTMTVLVNEAEISNGENQALLEQKLLNPNIITNYFHEHPPETAEHPMDPAIEVARLGLNYSRDHIKDYTAVLHKQERIGSKLMPKEVIEIKIRHNSVATGMEQSPMSVYVKFLAPKAMAGREVVWQKHRNKDKLTVHEYVFGRNVQLNLAPTGILAMRGNRYPMTEIGFETLVLRMIEKATRDRKYDECDVYINRLAKINSRNCTLIEISHPIEREHFEFHMAKIFIDDELNVPLRYAAYSWPKEKGGEPVLEEQYTFTDIRINVGLEDIDFDTKNTGYQFPN